MDSPSPSQEKALAALLAGRSVTDAAAAAEVNRSTVHHWMKVDFAFQAALNRGRRELREAIEARLMALAEKATECVEWAMAEGDGKAALALLKGLDCCAASRRKLAAPSRRTWRRKPLSGRTGVDS
jgi:hypothetical protein